MLSAILSMTMFPQVAVLTGLYTVIDRLDISAMPSMIFSYMLFTLPFTVWVLVAFFQALPDELLQSARVDGATSFQAFRLILFPLTAPALVTTGLLAFIAALFLGLPALEQGKRKIREITWERGMETPEVFGLEIEEVFAWAADEELPFSLADCGLCDPAEGEDIVGRTLFYPAEEGNQIDAVERFVFSESRNFDGGGGDVEGAYGMVVDLAGGDGAGIGDEEGNANAAFGEHAFFAVHWFIE